MRPIWTRIALGVLLLIVVALVLSQLLLPGYLEGRVADRLERGGGHAKVELKAEPAFVLLFDNGSKINVEAKGLNFDLDQKSEKVLDKLDGFDEVNVHLVDTRTGPFDEKDIAITRERGDDDYSMIVHASTTGQDLAAYAAQRAGGGFLGSLATRLATSGIDAANDKIPVELAFKLHSDNGDAQVEGSVADVNGVPLGPFAEGLANAVVSRL
jgi:hypothetical protein